MGKAELRKKKKSKSKGGTLRGLRFWQDPLIGRKKQRHVTANGTYTPDRFRKEDGDSGVNVPDWRMVCREGDPRVIRLEITSRFVHISQFRDLRRRIARQKRRQLARALRAEWRKGGPFRLDVVIRCGGGATSWALGIAQALARWWGPKRCLIDGECSSSATLIAFAPKWTIACTKNASMLIHKAVVKTYTGRIVDGVKRWKCTTRKSERPLNIRFERLYARRTGRSRGTVRAWMEEQKRFNGPALCAFGFADEMVEREAWEHDEAGKAVPHD